MGVASVAETIQVNPNPTIDLAWLAAQFPDLTNLAPIGQGGQKIVLSAQHSTDGPVVLKLIHPGQEVERTNRELIAITQVNSPRVPRVLERGQLTTAMGDCVWFREQRVQGESVRVRLRSGPFPANEVILLGLHVLETLADAEAVSIVHRDVKPDNIMRDLSGAYWLLDFGFVTGWRINSEVLPLQWRQVDLRVGEVRLDPGTTKNREGRVFYLTPELHQLLKEQRAAAEQIQRQKNMIVRHVFFHRDVTKAGDFGHWAGKGISADGFYHAWRTARVAAGCPGSIPHDFRRTAIRNMVRAGIPERVAMKLSGHKTRSVFDRYNVVSDGDLRDAASRLGHTGGHTSPSVAGFGNANPQNP